jgi:hypothetical protein
MSWWRRDKITVTHLPSGHSIQMEPSGSHGWYWCKCMCMKFLRSKVASNPDGLEELQPLVRIYDFETGLAYDRNGSHDLKSTLDGKLPAHEFKNSHEN